MPKRKSDSASDLDGDQTVPLPIQTFFWRQTSPFIRPKQGKLCEASCVSFERVVVQNILHGLSPSLCEAIQSVSRWKTIQAAFPHLMHACSSLLSIRKRTHPEAKFTPFEIKLLYTLHWIILDASSECSDAEPEKQPKGATSMYMHPLSTIQLFVYQFAPLIHTIKDEDFQSLKLENGLQLWQPLWEYRQPDIPCFSTPVKPQRNVLKAQRNLLKVNTNAANIYVGKGSSRENLTYLFDTSSKLSLTVQDPQSPTAPLARMSDICPLSSAASQAPTMEVMCEYCNTVMPMKSGEAGMTCKCGRKDSLVFCQPDSKFYAFQKLTSSVDKDYVKQRLASAVVSGNRTSEEPDMLSASYFDVAVLRCLFSLNWQEEGILWSLRYVHQRILEVCDEFMRFDHSVRARSRSLPMPDLDVLRGVPGSKAGTPDDNKSGLSTGHDTRTPSPQPTSPTITNKHYYNASFNNSDRKEPPFKKIRVIELKQFFDSGKMLLKKKESGEIDVTGSQSPKTCKTDSGSHGFKSYNDDSSSSCTISTVDTETELIRPNSVHGTYSSKEDKHSACGQRISMPTLPQSDRESVGSSSHHSGHDSSNSSKDDLQKPEPIRRPIITITEHSPDPKFPSNYDLCMSEGDAEESHINQNLSRSMTDSNIHYQVEEEIQEVAGSKYYIQDNGHLNYKVILRAVHFIALSERSPSICEVLLNILNCLVDLDIIEVHQQTPSPQSVSSPDSTITSQQTDKSPTNESSKGHVTAHSLAMESLFRIYKALGCPHGCGDGIVGAQGDHLRLKGQQCLKRLQKLNPPLFHKFLRDTVKKKNLQESVDFLHAVLGFCTDPTIILQSPQGNSQKKSASQETLPRNGYANNFGHSIGGEGYRGVEGVLIANVFKHFVSRCVESVSELCGHENIGLFCDVRQFTSYVKEIHGGTYRRIALSGLLDSLQKLRRRKIEKEREAKMAKPEARMRRTTSVTSDSGDEKEVTSQSPISSTIIHTNTDTNTPVKSRKSFFRRKLRKSLMFQYAASDSELLDEGTHGKRSPRTSISAAEDDSPSGFSTPRRRFSKFQIGWRRGTKSDHEDDSHHEMTGLDRRDSRSDVQVHTGRTKAKMSFKAASHATLTFLSARKKLSNDKETLMKAWNRGRAKVNSNDGAHGGKTGTSHDISSEAIIVKEKKMVDKYLIRSGMLRFSFLMECSAPGTFPDPQLVAAMLDLDAPVAARAAMLLECAHFIHRCNHGDWPNWMKLNLPSFRHTVAALQNRGQPSGYRRNLMLQRAAGRLFYSWAENLGSQLEYILAKEHADRLSIINDIKDETKKKELRKEDEEEDFLDEASVNEKGTECPYALKMLGCLVLLEITTFLRETFQYLPKSRSQKREHPWEKTVTSRRFSSIVSSPGHSDKSSESNIAELPQATGPIGSPGDRKISFAVLTERSDSIHSSTTSISVLDPNLNDEKKERGRRLAQGRQKLLRHFRRGSTHNASFRHNRSFKFKRQEGSGSIKQMGSLRSRKVSSQSLQSEAKFVEEDPVLTEDTESVTMLSDDTQESPGERDQEVEDEQLYQDLPWIKVVVQIANLSNFICPHHNYCHPNCYERQRRSCSRLITALRKIHDSTEESESDSYKLDQNKETVKEKIKRKESLFQLTSPTRRRESTPLLEKIKSDVSMTKLKLNSTWKKEEKPKEIKEDPLIIKYLQSQAQRLTQCPMTILCKAAPILSVENFIDMMPVAWELILESDQELAAAAASVFLLSSVKSPDKVRNMIIKELQHEETAQRINAVIRFGILWRFRYQVWPRMEEGSNLFFKIPPPGIDFTLPSPTIGLPNLTVIDPPWMPHFKTKIEEVTINQEESKSLVTATTTRRKQQQEMIRKGLHAEEERKRIGRENFPMMTVPVCQLAAYEPALHNPGEEHEEGDEDRAEHSHHLQMTQNFFPSSICAAVLPIIHLLDDCDVNDGGISVCEVANKVIWDSIVEDPILFFRHFLEKLTNKDKQEELLFVLRKLVLYYIKLPAQTAHALYNYLIGFVMFYARSPCEGGQEAIAGALELLHLVIPSVEGIFFKDLKQTLKKEQCDPYLLISANVANAKKILVHGPDLSSIPSQLPIHEDTQFSQILTEALEFFNIPEDQQNQYFLLDTKTNQIQNLNSYVRDFYFFRRNFYPQLSLTHMNPDTADIALQKRVFTLKFVEIGKTLFTNAVLSSTPIHQLQNHVSFLYEEFIKLPSFPRKALDAEFDLYHGEWGKELFSMDSLHKYAWAKLMNTMFRSMPSTFNWSNDLPLFLNVINGTVILLCEDTAVLRFCLASFINTCTHFKHIFATNGFLYIMPTLLRVYSNNQPNAVLKKAIHFVCRQFYILHRKPFMLQMFGSVAPLLDMTCGAGGLLDCNKAKKTCVDNLGVLNLVEGEKPLRALDFCYENDPDDFDLMDVINMCVTVVAYGPDSFRSGQMLTILEIIIPRYLQHLKKETTARDNPTAARAEIDCISRIAVSIRALLSCCEFFTRPMSIPQRHMETVNSNIKPMQNHSVHSLTLDDREDSHASFLSPSRHMEEGRRKTFLPDPDDLELRNEFRKPRDSLLSLVVEFYSFCGTRMKELRKVLADPTFRSPDLVDHKTHNRLAEIALTLLKLAPYDRITMACSGLQRYMTGMLPATDWSQESIRPALNLILRRLDRLFSKLSKKSGLRRQMNWDAAASILKGVYCTLRKFPYIAHLPHLKTLVNVLINILLSGAPGGPLIPEGGTTISSSCRTDGPASVVEVPPIFCSAVVKLVAMQMQFLGDQYTFEQLCGGMAMFQVTERTLSLLVNFILPLCIRVGCGRKDMPKLSHVDVLFICNIICNLLSQGSKVHGSNNNAAKSHLSIGEYGRSGSISQDDKPKHRMATDIQQWGALLGLEILMVCFDKQLAGEWHKVAKTIQNLASRGRIGLPLWNFIDFVTTHRPSLFLILQTFIEFRMMKVNCDTAQEYYLQQTIRDKLQGYSFTHPKSCSSILIQLATELKQLREEIASNNIAGYRSRTATFATDRSDSYTTQVPDRSRPSFSEIAMEIIGPFKPVVNLSCKRASRATIFSQSSSASGPQRSGTSEEVSPLMIRHKSSKRISAHDGSKILEKFTRKNTIDDISPDQVEFEGSPLIKRKGTIRGGRLSKQSSMDDQGTPAHVLFENEENEAANGGAIHTINPDTDDPRGHRLQRQDAKSRKTFKIRRQKTKTTSMRRFMSHRRRPDHGEDGGSSEESPQRIPGTAVVFHEQASFQLRRPTGVTMARSVETIPESVEAKVHPNAARV
ncbi:hypothetical protein LOTGIDRAFT_232936 [Lottia gigantea]|uniref:Uncharacterized protein n=1 Tax=Lottia gigantea TaxID=225164 RepID=V3ZNA4_LOTGI|nr:hypothetical protein LOTGIDRAFT_232936 [Lottia gigantea]ESO92838.1 hypothetical protein LOTGIDRAFT_232936 [Lottia gigantea]